MSKAFTDEEAGDEPPLVPARAPLPPGTPNYVTPRGLVALRTEAAALQAQRAAAERIPADLERAHALGALARRRTDLEQRIASAEVVEAVDPHADAVRFGALVTVSGPGGERRYRIVGVDEADPAHGRIAFVSPLARALLGRAVGDAAHVRTPRGEEDLEILAIDATPEPF